MKLPARVLPRIIAGAPVRTAAHYVDNNASSGARVVTTLRRGCQADWLLPAIHAVFSRSLKGSPRVFSFHRRFDARRAGASRKKRTIIQPDDDDDGKRSVTNGDCAVSLGGTRSPGDSTIQLDTYIRENGPFSSS